MEGAWWWNEEIKEKVKAKKEAYAEFMRSSSEGEREQKKSDAGWAACRTCACVLFYWKWKFKCHVR